jgi:hypothetical protein
MSAIWTSKPRFFEDLNHKVPRRRQKFLNSYVGCKKPDLPSIFEDGVDRPLDFTLRIIVYTIHFGLLEQSLAKATVGRLNHCFKLCKS